MQKNCKETMTKNKDFINMKRSLGYIFSENKFKMKISIQYTIFYDIDKGDKIYIFAYTYLKIL